jgi:hypothetical protein
LENCAFSWLWHNDTLPLTDKNIAFHSFTQVLSIYARMAALHNGPLIQLMLTETPLWMGQWHWINSKLSTDWLLCLFLHIKMPSRLFIILWWYTHTIKIQFIPHRKHTLSPLQRPAGFREILGNDIYLMCES